MSSRILAIPNEDHAEFAREKDDCRKEVHQLLRVMGRLLALNSRGIGSAIKTESDRLGISASRLRALYDEFRNSCDWRVLVNRRKFPVPGGVSVIPPKLIEKFQELCQKNQRKTRPAHRALMRLWESNAPVDFEWPPVDPYTGEPMGCSERNLRRYGLTKYEEKAVRIGRSAASQMLPKVLSTRIGIEIGEVFVNDDQDYDVQVAFTGVNRHPMRPAGFNTLDYASGCDVLQGYKPTVIKSDGSKVKLRQVDYQWHCVSLLTTIGYRNDDKGTTIIDEHGTAKAGKDFWERVALATGGKVSFTASGIHGEQVAGMFRGAPRGNPRFKAARESWFNLLRNEMAALPGPSGMDRQHAPEEFYGLAMYTRDLLQAIMARPDLADAFELPVLRWPKFVQAAGLIVHQINTRTDHELEGWENRMAGEWRLDLSQENWLPKTSYLQLPAPQRSVVDAMIRTTPGLWRERRLSPFEVWETGRPGLTRVEGAMIPVLLGPEGGRPATVTSDHHIVIEDMEIETDAMWFDAALNCGRILHQGQKVLVYLNPFVTTGLEVCDVAGRWLGTAPRVQRICKTDTDALARRYGQVRKIESQLLAPVAKRGAEQFRERIEMHERNAALLDGGAAAQSKEDARARKRAARFGAALRDQAPEATPDPFGPEDAEDFSPEASPTNSTPPSTTVEEW